MDMANTNGTKTALADMEALRRINYRPEEDSPACAKDCFACTDGKCCILTDNDFGERECPFYKTWDRVKREQRAGLERLVALGKYEFIEKNESILAALGIFALLDDDVQQMAAELEMFEETDLRECIAETEKEEEWID